MATIRETFFDKLASGAKWDVGVSINRTNGVPLDVYSVFQTEDELNSYVAGVFAYPGQILALVEESATTIYYIDQNKTLQEVGKVPVGDGRTIEVVDGKIQIKADGGKNVDTETGAVSYIAGAQLVLQADGSLKWEKPDTTTVEGLNTTVNALDKTVNGYTIPAEEEGGEDAVVPGLTTKVSALETKAGNLQTEIDAVEKNLADNYYDKEDVDGLVSGAFHFQGNADHFDDEGNLWVDADQTILAKQTEGYVYQLGDKEYVWDGKAWIELGFNVDLTSYATKAYVGTEIGTAKTELIGLPAEGEEAVSSANTIAGAKKYAEEKASAAQSAADAAAQGYAGTAEQNAKGYTDDEIEKINTTLEGYATTDALDGVKKTADAALPKATYDNFVAAEGAFGVAQKDIGTLKSTVSQHTTDIGTAQTTANEAKTAAEAAQATADKAVVANAAITAGTHIKITYDEKGLVTGGSNLAAADIPTLDIDKINGLQDALNKKQPTGDYATKTEVADAKSDLLGETTDPTTAETIRGAKAAAAEALAEAKKKANSEDVYTKDKVYNKEEIGNLTDPVFEGETLASVAVYAYSSALTLQGQDTERSAREIAAEEAAAAVKEIKIPTYSVAKDDNSGDYAAVYHLTKDGTNEGVAINIPKDMMVQSGEVKELAAGEAGEGKSAGTYIVLTLANSTNDKIYIPADSLIEYVTSGSGENDAVQIAISDEHKVTASIKDHSISRAKIDEAFGSDIRYIEEYVIGTSPIISALIGENYDGISSIKDIAEEAIAEINNIATTEKIGTVKSVSDDTINGVAVAADGTMSVNSLSTDKLVQGTKVLIISGGKANTATTA